MKKKSILIFILLIFFVGCGRKQKNIFHFPSDKPTLKIHKLILPAVKGVKIKRTLEGNLISWLEVQPCREIQVNETEKVEVEFVGYNIYRLVKNLFVPKSTINQFWIKDTQFLDTQILQKNLVEQHHCYVVRAVFRIGDKIIQSPSSQVIFEK